MQHNRQEISTRLASWRKSGDPSTLWPSIPPNALAGAVRRITEVAQVVLTGGLPRAYLETDREVSTPALGAAAYRTGMGPLLGYWIQSGRVEAQSGLAALMREHLTQSERRARIMHDAMLRILDGFASAGVTGILLKGAHTSRAYFPLPGARPCADIDLLVTDQDIERASAALRGLGFVEVRRTQRPWRSEWIEPGHSTTPVSLDLDHADNPWSVDLHRSLSRHYFRGVQAGFDSTLWRTNPLDLDGRSARVLAQPLLTAFLAMHAGYGIDKLRLIHLVELVLVIRQDVGAGALEWVALQELLSQTRTERFLYPGLELAERLAPGTLDSITRERLQCATTPRMRRVVEAVHASGMQLPRRTLDERLMWACGFRELLRNIGDVVWPSDEALSSEVPALYLRRARLLTHGRVGMRS